jgi:hypothetical protein
MNHAILKIIFNHRPKKLKYRLIFNKAPSSLSTLPYPFAPTKFVTEASKEQKTARTDEICHPGYRWELFLGDLNWAWEEKVR